MTRRPSRCAGGACLRGSDVAHQREQLRWSGGCDQFAVYLMHDDEDAMLDAYGSEIIPALSR